MARRTRCWARCSRRAVVSRSRLRCQSCSVSPVGAPHLGHVVEVALSYQNKRDRRDRPRARSPCCCRLSFDVRSRALDLVAGPQRGATLRAPDDRHGAGPVVVEGCRANGGQAQSACTDVRGQTRMSQMRGDANKTKSVATDRTEDKPSRAQTKVTTKRRRRHAALSHTSSSLQR